MTIVGGVVFLVVLSVTAAKTVQVPGLKDCLESDSLECVQDHIFRSLRVLFGQDVQGVSVVRKVRAAEVPMSSKDPGQRSELMNEKGGVPTSNSTGESPGEDKHDEASGAVEGRGNKKLKKLILPFLLMLNFKHVVYGVLAYIVVALITKAALIKGSLALALTILFLLRRILTPLPVVARTEVKFHQSSYTKTYGGGAANYGAAAAAAAANYGAADYGAGYGAGYGGGFGDTQSGSGWDSYNAPLDQNRQYSHNNGHSVAYRGQKPEGR